MAAERSDVDNYDVFINFRGADTRQGFVYRLYDALVVEGIRVFLDDEELNPGKRFDEELPQAINNSKIYVTVISQTYASSKWCLRELAEIVRNKQEFKDKKEILPVFYKITPEDVKLKTDLFKDQLNSLVNKNVTAETVQVWAEALRGIPNLKAWTVPIDGGYKQDGECCRDIVKRVSIILRVKHKPLPKVLIGMEDPVKEVMQLLDIGNPGFQVIGIHGMGGSGKTTLAKAVYNKICDKFDSCCFLPDVRESLDKDKGSRACLELQKKLLKEVSYRGDVDEIRDVEDAVRIIQLTLQGKKVLMVFDDVSKPDQIMRLICNNGDIDMLNRSGSRIIITTRDDRVLRNREFVGFTKIHEMKAMEDGHALELFSWNAFGEPMPPMDYTELSKEAVSLTGRLPLSLEITGSLFFIGGRKNWKQTVEKLKKMPNKEVQERLKISYEDLEEGTKEIFLDIACFFVNKKVSHEVAIWAACEFYPELAIEELISMCLVKIDESYEFGIHMRIYRMHDHIKDLGRDIVRQEGPKDLEQRSRIWKKQDSIDILTSRKKENNKIEGIIIEDLKLTEVDDEILNLRAENFVNLDKLRFLHVEGQLFPVEIQVEGSFRHLLPNLRWLSLQCMKMMRFNATNFNLKKLVVLNFSWSNITESWAGWKEFKNLPSLEVLNLAHCKGLKKTPDLSHCTSLKKLYLVGCDNLEEIDRSIICLKALEYLDLAGCRSLKELPADEQLEDSSRLQEGGKLQHLSLSLCESLESLPNSITSLSKLRHLDLFYCRKLKKLPDSIGELVELEVLNAFWCESLVSLPNSLTSLPKLHILKVNGCKSLESLPNSVGEMVQLTQLDISNVALKKLPRFISKQKKLEVLCANGIKMLRGVPKIKELTCLREMSFNESSICGLPSLVKLTCLEKLSLMNCNRLQQLPAQLPTSLVQLRVKSSSLQSIPDYSYLIHLTKLTFWVSKWRGDLGGVQELNLSWIWRLSKLKKLLLCIRTYCKITIESEESSSSVSLLSQLKELTLRCSVLETCAVIPSFLSALTRLDISLFRGTTSLSLPRLNQLTHFELSDSEDLEQILGLGELESLISLKITSCKSLERLDDISKLTQLLYLEISKCKKLRVIPVVPSLRSLKELVIEKCPLLDSLIGPSESESFLDYRHQVKRVTITDCPLLETIIRGSQIRNKSEQLEEDKHGFHPFCDILLNVRLLVIGLAFCVLGLVIVVYVWA